MNLVKTQIPTVEGIRYVLFYHQFVSRQSGFAFFSATASVAALFYFREEKQMKNDVKIMTDVFKYAMIFEKHKKLWSDALNHVDHLLANNNSKNQRALTGIEQEEFIIATAKDKNDVYIENAKKDIKKYKIIITTILSIIAVLLITFTLLFLLNLQEVFVMLFMVFSLILVGPGPIVILGIIVYCLYNVHKRKKDIKNLTSQNVDQQINVATNNIQSYNSFIQKAKSERTHLLTKKQIIMTELNKAKSTLAEIYSYGLIPERFQGLAQTSTIYGYLHDGICTNICGHGGVYERYLNDLQIGIITEQLSSINRKLDVVIKNQQELISVLNSIDTTLSGIKKEVEYGNQLLGDIRTTSAIGAAAAQQSAAHHEYIATAVWRNL